MKISYYIKHKLTGEVVPIEFKGLQSYHTSYKFYDRPVIWWDQWDNWERYKPTKEERRICQLLEDIAKEAGL